MGRASGLGSPITIKSYQEVIGNLNTEDFKSSLANKLPTQEEVDIFNTDNSHKTGEDLTTEYLQNDVEILDYCMNEYVKLSMKELNLNPLPYVSLPRYSFCCWLMSSGVILDTLQAKQVLDGFVEAKRGGNCGIMGDRYININNSNRVMAEHDRSQFYLVHRCKQTMWLCNEAKATL